MSYQDRGYLRYPDYDREWFLENFRKQNYRVTIIQAGEHLKHIVFKNPDSIDQWFEIITWKGSLCISGDMGTFVFSRLPDMFQFFRLRGGANINPSYYAEKLDAIDSRGSVREFSVDKSKKFISESIQDIKDEGIEYPDDAFSDDPWGDEAESISYESEHAFADSFWRSNISKHVDLFHQFMEYSYRYIWCLHAIAYAIDFYDSHLDSPLEELGTKLGLE